jgi:hypothetical protein
MVLSRMEMTEEKFGEFEDGAIEITRSKNKEENKIFSKSEKSFRNLRELCLTQLE